ncbi:MAG: FtsX-like permease family protein, partial [Clostridium sp.]
IWVESRKKEIILRKIMGATDFKISLLFFGELFIICMASIIIALLGQLILKTATGGMVMNLDLSMSVSNIIYSILLTGIMSLIIAVPFLSDLKKIQPIEIIRED